MKPFNLEEALQGEPVILRNGVFGKGVQDIPNAQRDPIYRKAYSRWYNLLQRCYSSEFKKKNPTYTRSCMCDEWLTFSKFYDWLVSFDNWENLEIDKDLLSGYFYSPETCLLIPKKLNCFLTFSQSTNTSMIGVNYYTPKGQKQGVFRATISMKRYGKTSNKHLGHFNTPLEGHLAWLEAKIHQLDEHIESSFSKLKEILEKLKTYMLTCLNNKQEFEGLNGFRESLGIGMWQEPTPTVTVTLPKPFKPKVQETYFTITSDASYRPLNVRQTYNAGCSLDEDLVEAGLCFRTEEDAQAWIDAMIEAKRV